MSLLFITAGTKGGIGKTLTATFLADAAIYKKLKTVLYDCDNENESLKNAYPNPAKNCRVESIDVSKTKTGYPLDAVVNDIYKTEKESKGKYDTVYVMDMKAGTTHYTLEWMEAFPFELINSLGVRIYIVGCVTSDIDSVQTLTRWSSRFADAAKKGLLSFLIVKNHFQGDKFNSYEDTLKNFMEEENSSVIMNLPGLEAWYIKPIKENGTTFGRVAVEELIFGEIDMMAVSRIKTNFNLVVAALTPIFRASCTKNSKT